ncbi:MAG: hypothetical protein KJ606_10410 [Chloroflexi bacterium]|nr:hypothetical protein [Chloroflexota bacterium]
MHEPSGRFGMEAAYHEKPSVTLERLSRLEQVMLDEIKELRELTSSRLE